MASDPGRLAWGRRRVAAGSNGLPESGFVARGVVYGIIGILALKLAFGAGGKATDQKGALETLAQQPFGKVLLILVAIGLAGYALWRFVRAALGHGVEATNDSGFDRVAALASGIVYAGLCAIAVSILVGSSQGGSGSGASQKATGGVLGWPAGQWLVGLAGAVMIGVAIYQGYRGVTKDFLKDSKTEEMSAPGSRLGGVDRCRRPSGPDDRVRPGRRVPDQSRGRVQPQAAIGLDGALRKLAAQTYGSVLLGLVAAGLIAFALYSLSDARYRRI